MDLKRIFSDHYTDARLIPRTVHRMGDIRLGWFAAAFGKGMNGEWSYCFYTISPGTFVESMWKVVSSYTSGVSLLRKRKDKINKYYITQLN